MGTESSAACDDPRVTAETKIGVCNLCEAICGLVLTIEDGLVEDVRIAWGGVAHKPWRAERAEALLRGQELTEEAVVAAVEDELADAQTDDETAFKPAMLRRTTAWTLLALAEGRTR